MTITLNGTTGITLPNGSASAPAATGSDTDTGIVYGTNTVQVATGGTTAVTVDSSQNVGIGTSSPSNVLQVAKSQTADTAIIVSNAGTANAATTMSFVLAESTTPQGWFRRYRDGSGLTEVGYTDILAFSGNVTGTKAERMRIDSPGGLRINTTSYIANGGEKLTVTSTSDTSFFQCSNVTTNNGTSIHVNRNNSTGNLLYFSYGGGFTGVGSISTNGSTTSYTTTSDYRLKENIEPMAGALAKVSALKPCTYTWKSTGEASQGFIAHELQAVVPDCVTGEKDAVELVDIKDEKGNVIGQEERPVYQGIDTSFLVATLTAAIQELKAELDTIKTELATLKGTV